MSVDSYFPGPPDARMPESPGDRDALGIRSEGPVMTGKMGVREAIQNEAIAQTHSRESSLPPLGLGIKVTPGAAVPYQFPNAADRLVSVDPVMANYRAQFGPPPSTTYTHPEQYDPVLRAHLHMPPAHDPYEAQRKRHAAWQAEREKHVVK